MRLLLLAAAGVSSLIINAPPNDPLYLGGTSHGQTSDAWNLMGTVDPAHPAAGVRGIDAEGAWAITAGRPDVLIAILDSGVRTTLDDLAANIDLNYGETVANGCLVDVNGDGLLTFDEAQAVVTDLDQDSKVTPEDVRIFCEDGVDDDANGYVDDIIGWDFYENDNDPNDVYGHGSGRAGIAAAVGNNSIGMIGVCPGCRILPVRMGRTFVAVPDNLAEAIAYAADRGAAATVMANGAIGNSAGLRAAVEYADSKNVVQCAAMGNENNKHTHFPQSYEDVIGVAGITVYDDHDHPTDWSARWKGSDFGGHSLIGAPTYVWATRLDGQYDVDGGTSSSTPHCAGVAGLVVSRARDLGIPITARQVRSIMTSTADLYPAFDAKRGYGRLNAKKAVEAVGAMLPPDARLATPRWYDTYAKGEAVPVTVDVRTAGATASVEMGYGVEPSSWSAVTGTTVLPDPPAPMVATTADEIGNSYAVTLRLTSTATNGLVTLDRRTFFVHSDPDLVPGFPIRVGSSLELGASIADLDGDNRMELIVPTSDGRIAAYDSTGAMVPGWPVAFDRTLILHTNAAAHLSGAVPADESAMSFTPVSVGDLDGDGKPEVVAGALDGKVYAFHGDGSPVAGFPLVLGAPVWSGVVLADVDGDGALDLVVGSFDRELHVFHADGTELPGFPVQPEDATANSNPPGLTAMPAVGDLDGDGKPEIIVATSEALAGAGGIGSNGRVYAYHADGTPLAGWPVKPFGLLPETFPVVGAGVSVGPLIADLDGDSTPEIIVVAAAGQVAAYEPDGSLFVAFDGGDFLDGFSGLPKPKHGADPAFQLNVSLLAEPVASDLTNDGHPEVFEGTMGLPVIDIDGLTNSDGPLTILQSVFTMWKPDGTVRHPFPKRIEGWTLFSSPSVADLDGDTLPEVIAGNDGGWMHAWNARGEEPPSWPKFTGGWMSAIGAVGDLDGDGKLEVVSGTREGSLFAWKTPGAACVNGKPAVRWSGFHKDGHATGDITSDGVPPAAVADARVEGGKIAFTAVGDDYFAGAAASYDARWSASPIDSEAAFAVATAVTVTAHPVVGTTVTAGSGIPAGAHVAVIARDAHGNRSPLPAPGAITPPAGECVSAAVIRLDGAGGGGGCGCDVGGAGSASGQVWLLAAVALCAIALLRVIGAQEGMPVSTRLGS